MTRVAIEHLLNLYERTHGPAGDVQTVARAALSAMDERDRLEAQVAAQAQEIEVLRREVVRDAKAIGEHERGSQGGRGCDIG